MTRKIMILLGIVLVICNITLNTNATEKTIIYQNNFESDKDLSSWPQGVKVILDKESRKSGISSLIFTPDHNSAVYFYPKIKPGYKYEVTLWYKANKIPITRNGVTINFNKKSGSNGSAGTKEMSFKKITANNQWQKFTEEFIIPEDAASCQFILNFYRTDAIINIDDLQIYAIRPATIEKITNSAGKDPVTEKALPAEEAVIDNSRIQVTIDSRGGRISSFILKSDKRDFAAKGTESLWQGLSKERVFINDKSSLINENFSLNKKTDSVSAVLKTSTALTVTKKYTLVDGKSAVKIDVSITGASPETVFAVHNFLPSFNVKRSKGYYWSADGKIEHIKKPGDINLTCKNAQWFMTKTDKTGICAYFINQTPDILLYYLSSVGTLEWKYAPVKGNGKLHFSYMIHIFNPKEQETIPDFLKENENIALSDDNIPLIKNVPVNSVPPLITEIPPLPPKKSGYAFVSNIEQIAYISPECPSMIHFLPINKSHKPDLFLALPKGINWLGGFRNFQFANQGERIINGQTFNITKIITFPSSSKYTFFWQAEAALVNTGKKNFTGYFWGEWGDEKQDSQLLNIELVNIPKVIPFKNIPVWMCLPSDLSSIWPDMTAMRNSGFNYMDVWTYTRKGAERSKWGEKILLDTKEKCDAAGIKLIAWIREWWWTNAKKDINGAALDINGKEVNQLCLSYRGKYYDELLEQGRYLIDKGFYFHSTDPEMYSKGDEICFCPLCIANFQKFLTRIYPDLTYKSPIEFEETPEKYNLLHSAWNDFKVSRYADFFGDYRKAMETYMKSKGITESFKMCIYSTYHRSWNGFYGYKNYKDSPIYIKTLEDPEKLAKVFDIIAPMTYMDIYANYNNYDMLLPWQDTISLQRIIGNKCSIAPLLSSGYPFIVAYDSDISAELLKYNILESFIGGAKGVGFWGVCPLDAKDMKVIAEVVKMLTPYEQVIIDGKPSDNISAISGNVFVKRIESMHGSLALISEYSERVITAEIKCSVKESSEVIDLETQKVIATITPENSVFKVKLDKNRAVMFYIGKFIKKEL